MSLSSWNQTADAMFPSPSKRLIRSKSGLKIVAQHDRNVPPWNLEEPHWVKDEEVTQCIECKTKFDFIKRRHHCRRCGKIFCGKCCGNKVQFHRMAFVDPVRLCDPCGEVTKKEKLFFDNDLKLLFIGAPFHTRNTDGISQESFLYNIKLSNDERFLVFENLGESGEDIGPIDLCKIAEISDEGTEGSDVKVSIKVRTVPADVVEYTIEAPPEPSKQPSVMWISAFRKGMEMVFESRSICREDPSDP